MTAYEFGRIYLPAAGQVQPDERLRLSIGMYGQESDFYAVKGIVESVLEYHGIKELWHNIIILELDIIVFSCPM